MMVKYSQRARSRCLYCNYICNAGRRHVKAVIMMCLSLSVFVFVSTYVASKCIEAEMYQSG